MFNFRDAIFRVRLVADPLTCETVKFDTKAQFLEALEAGMPLAITQMSKRNGPVANMPFKTFITGDAAMADGILLSARLANGKLVFAPWCY